MGFSTSKRHASRKPALKTLATRAVPRTIRNQRWVPSEQLEVGMYVMELDRPWLETRFLFQGFLIDNHTLLRDVQSSCQMALVQTEKVPASAPVRVLTR